MTRLVMGSKPSENASRGENQAKFPLAYKALTVNSYVDNMFIMASNHKELDQAIAETEKVANSGGFYYKEWPRSGIKSTGSILVASALSEEACSEEKALGLRWETATDVLYIKVDVDKAPKKVNKKNEYSVISERKWIVSYCET